jgi:hypothetical protein
LEALNKLGCGGPPRSARAGRASSGGLAFPARAQTGAGERDVQILFECSADVPILGMEIPDPKGLKPAFDLDLFEGPYAPLWTSRSLVCAAGSRASAEGALNAEGFYASARSFTITPYLDAREMQKISGVLRLLTEGHPVHLAAGQPRARRHADER